MQSIRSGESPKPLTQKDQSLRVYPVEPDVAKLIDPINSTTGSSAKPEVRDFDEIFGLNTVIRCVLESTCRRSFGAHP